MALPLFFHRLLDDFCLQAFFGIHLLEAFILRLKLLKTGNHGGVHTAIFGTLFIEGGTAHAVLTTQISNAHAALMLFKNR